MREVVLTLALCITGFVSPSVAYAGRYNPRVGQQHPDFTLPSIATGKPVTLSQYRGKKVLLIHFASW